MTTPRLCQRCGAPAMAGAFACPYCGVAFEGAPPGAGAGASPKMPGADPDIVDLIAKGNKIEAIKLYRERYKPPGLLEAKNAVEEIERQLQMKRR